MHCKVRVTPDVTLVPRHATVPGRGSQRALLHSGRVYDAISWPAGRPLNRYGTFSLMVEDTINLPLPDSMAAPEVLIETIRTLAHFHLATRTIAERADAPVFTLQTMLTVADANYEALRKTVGSQPAAIRRFDGGFDAEIEFSQPLPSDSPKPRSRQCADSCCPHRSLAESTAR